METAHIKHDEYRFDRNNWKDTDYRDAFNAWLTDSRILTPAAVRLLQADSGVLGGYLLPEITANQLWKQLDDLVFMRQLATIHSIRGESMSLPIMANRIEDPSWKGEISEADLDDELSFESAHLVPHRLTEAIKVSRKFLRLANCNPEQVVRDELAYKMSYVLENGYLNGEGGLQPLGLFTASNAGIGTDRDVATNNTTVAIKADNLIDVVYSLKSQYRRDPSCRWIFSRQAIKMIRKLKDGEGNYLWESGIGTDRPPTILSIPCIESELCPSTFTTGKYVGILGAMRFYGICDSRNIEIQRLVEKYALEDSDAFIASAYSDGMPLISEAFSRVTLA